MEESYGECHKTHEHLGGKIDGCQEFWGGKGNLICKVCGCHRNFHRKMYPDTECRKIHTFGSQVSVDGCQEFIPAGRKGSPSADKCATCGCDEGFHRSHFTTT